jgi:hypothetical protein
MNMENFKMSAGLAVLLVAPGSTVVLLAICLIIGYPLKWERDSRHARIEESSRMALDKERALLEDLRKPRPKTGQDEVIELFDRRVEFHPSTNPEDYVLRRMAQDDRQYWNYLPPDRDSSLTGEQGRRHAKGEIPDFTPVQLAAIRARRLPHSYKGSVPLEFQDINSGTVERSRVWSFLIAADEWVDTRKAAINQAYPAVAASFKEEEFRNEDPNRHAVHLRNVEKKKALERAWETWLAEYDRRHIPPQWATWVTPDRP